MNHQSNGGNCPIFLEIGRNSESGLLRCDNAMRNESGLTRKRDGESIKGYYKYIYFNKRYNFNTNEHS
jgi:hypothetical protein